MIPLLLILLLVGCQKRQEERDMKLSASEWYTRGQAALGKGKGGSAVESFEKVIQYYPYDEVVADAQLNLIKAHRLDGTHESAIANADVFLQIYPAHDYVSEVLFLKGMSYFDQVTGEREETQAVKALDCFHALKKRDPEFRREEREKCETLLYNILVSGVMEQAIAFWRRKGIFAAINCYTEASRYPKNNFTNEVFFRLMEGFTLLSLDDEARYALSKIDQDSRWYAKGQKFLQQHAP